MNKQKSHSTARESLHLNHNPFEDKFRIGVVLKELRQTRGVRQISICDNKNIKQSYISQCEKGEKTVSLKIVKAYASALGLPIQDLISYLVEKYREFLIHERIKTEAFMEMDKTLSEKDLDEVATSFLNQNPKYDVKFWQNLNNIEEEVYEPC